MRSLLNQFVLLAAVTAGSWVCPDRNLGQTAQPTARINSDVDHLQIGIKIDGEPNSDPNRDIELWKRSFKARSVSTGVKRVELGKTPDPVAKNSEAYIVADKLLPSKNQPTQNVLLTRRGTGQFVPLRPKPKSKPPSDSQPQFKFASQKTSLPAEPLKDSNSRPASTSSVAEQPTGEGSLQFDPSIQRLMTAQQFPINLESDSPGLTSSQLLSSGFQLNPKAPAASSKEMVQAQVKNLFSDQMSSNGISIENASRPINQAQAKNLKRQVNELFAEKRKTTFAPMERVAQIEKQPRVDVPKPQEPVKQPVAPSVAKKSLSPVQQQVRQLFSATPEPMETSSQPVAPSIAATTHPSLQEQVRKSFSDSPHAPKQMRPTVPLLSSQQSSPPKTTKPEPTKPKPVAPVANTIVAENLPARMPTTDYPPIQRQAATREIKQEVQEVRELFSDSQPTHRRPSQPLLRSQSVSRSVELAPTPAPVPQVVQVTHFEDEFFETDSNPLRCSCNDGSCAACSRRTPRAKDFWTRDTPSGDMTQRIPYQSEQMYYYRRPYAAQHVSEQKQESLMNGDYTPSQPYSHPKIDSLHQQIDLSLESTKEDLVENGYLEYVDWREHRAKPPEQKDSEPKFRLDARNNRPTSTRR